MSTNHPRITARNAGFSLVELLIVISIFTLMAVLVRPAIVSLASAGSFTSNVANMNDIVQQARAAACAQNTFVWLGLATASTNGSPSVVVAAVAGKSGLSSDYGAGNTYPIMKPIFLRNTQLVSSAGSKFSSFSSQPGYVSSTTDCLNPATPFTNYPQTIAGATFQSVIEFSPDGEVVINANSATISKVSIGLQAGPVAAVNSQVALIQISGSSGRPSLFLE